MKTINLLVLFFGILTINAQTTYTHISDSNFEAALSAYDDIPNDYQVPTAAIDTITVLDISHKNISDLTGIQAFVALKHFDCGYNQITDLDLSQNTQLEWLRAWHNQISNVDITNCPNLNMLQIGDNQLTQIDVGQNTNLYYLELYNNQLTDLDVSDLSHLAYLYFSNNQVSQIDLTGLTNLYRFEAFNNQLTIINFNDNPNLHGINIKNNQLTEVYLQNGHNTDLLPSISDFRDNPDLHCIFVDDVNWCQQNLNGVIDPQTHFVSNQTECDAVSVQENLNSQIHIYPNPADNKIYIDIPDTMYYQILDMQGKLIQTGKIYPTGNILNIQNFQKGIYIIHIKNQIFNLTKRIIIH